MSSETTITTAELIAIIIEECARAETTNMPPEDLKARLVDCLTEKVPPPFFFLSA